MVGFTALLALVGARPGQSDRRNHRAAPSATESTTVPEEPHWRDRSMAEHPRARTILASAGPVRSGQKSVRCWWLERRRTPATSRTSRAGFVNSRPGHRPAAPVPRGAASTADYARPAPGPPVEPPPGHAPTNQGCRVAERGSCASAPAGLILDPRCASSGQTQRRACRTLPPRAPSAALIVLAHVQQPDDWWRAPGTAVDIGDIELAGMYRATDPGFGQPSARWAERRGG